MERSGRASRMSRMGHRCSLPGRVRIGGSAPPAADAEDYTRDEFGDDPEVRLCRPGGSHERDASDRSDLKRRGRRPATIARKLAAIAVYHRSMDHPTPTDHDVVRAVVRGTRRQLGVAQPQKTALEIEALRTVVLACGGCAIARCYLSAGRRRCAVASSSRWRSPTWASSPRGSC
jgi:hypothetical protein